MIYFYCFRGDGIDCGCECRCYDVADVSEKSLRKNKNSLDNYVCLFCIIDVQEKTVCENILECENKRATDLSRKKFSVSVMIEHKTRHVQRRHELKKSPRRPTPGGFQFVATLDGRRD